MIRNIEIYCVKGVNIMKTKVTKIYGKLVENVTYGIEKIFSGWIILSWIILLLSYSLLIVSSTLFTLPPEWLGIVGLSGVYYNSVNFFIAIVVAFIYLIQSILEKDTEVIYSRVSFILLYSAVSGFLYFVLAV